MYKLLQVQLTKLTALAGTLLNSLPLWCVRLPPCPLVETAYHQLNRARLEGMER